MTPIQQDIISHWPIKFSYLTKLTRCRSPEQTVHGNMNDSKRNQDVTTRLDHGIGDTRHIGVVMTNQACDEGTGSLNSGAEKKRFTSSKVLNGPHGGDDCGEGDTAENGLDSCKSLSNATIRCDFLDLQYAERGTSALSKNTGPYCVEI